MLIWADETRGSLAAVAADAVAVLPVGAVEQHGPHLPTKVDAAIAAEVARRAGEHLTGSGAVPVVLLPVLAFGSSDHHLPFSGTLSLTSTTFARVLDDLLRSLRAGGFRRVVLLNAHGGNVDLCREAARRAAVDHRILAAAVSYWQLLEPVSDPAHVPGHAGAFETSTMLAIDPESVRMDLAERSPGRLEPAPHAAVAVEDPGDWEGIGGFTDDPRAASAQLGERSLAAAARALAAVIEHLGHRSVRRTDTL